MLEFPTRWLGVLVAVGLCVSAHATVIEIVSLEEMVDRSDLIVRGEVTSTEGKLVGGRIETTVHVKVQEKWKGGAVADDLVLTQMGGVIEHPVPIGQAVPGLPSFAPKEKVILFLSSRKPNVTPEQREKALAANGGVLPALWTSPQVVGGFQGKYNIYSDPKTKKDMVIRQSSLAAQGTDADAMPPEVQAKIAASVAMAESGTEGLNADGTRPAGQLAGPAPKVAVEFDSFRAEVRSLVGKGAAKAAFTVTENPVPPSGALPSSAVPSGRRPAAEKP